MTIIPQKLYKDKFTYNHFPALSGSPKGLLVVMHGHGSSADNWIERCEQAREVMPDLSVIALQGQHVIPKHEGKDSSQIYEWVPMSTPVNLGKAILTYAFGQLKLASEVNKFLSSRLKDDNLKADQLCLCGASAGGIFALQTAFASNQTYGAVLGMSTAVLPFTKIRTKQEVYLAIGEKDGIFNTSDKVSLLSLQFNSSVARLKKSGIEPTTHIYSDVRHKMTDEMWYDALGFASSKMNMTFEKSKKRITSEDNNLIM